MLRQAIHQWFWDLYDHLGRVVAWNLILTVIFFSIGYYGLYLLTALLTNLPSELIRMFVRFGAFILFLPPILAFWFSSALPYAYKASQRLEPQFSDFYHSLKSTYIRFYLFSLIYCVIQGFLLMNFWFYYLSGAIPAELQLISFLASGIFLWANIGFLAIAVIYFPLAARTSKSPFTCLKTATLCLIRFPIFLLLALVFLSSLWIIAWGARLAPVLLFGWVGTAFLMNSILDLIDLRLSLEEKFQKEYPAKTLPKKWFEIISASSSQTIMADWYEKYQRSMREILKPWE